MQKVQTIRIPKGKVAEINLYITQTTGAPEEVAVAPAAPARYAPPQAPADGPSTEWKGRTLQVAKPPQQEEVDPREALRLQLMQTIAARNEKKRLAGSGLLRGGCFSKRCRC